MEVAKGGPLKKLIEGCEARSIHVHSPRCSFLFFPPILACFGLVLSILFAIVPS